jgi:hypothetical protein
VLAIVAAILFGVALLLDILDTGGEVITALMLAGLLAVALHLAAPISWRRNSP